MSILTDVLPDAVEIDGREYPVDTDFRAALRAIAAFEDNDLANLEKQMIVLANLYPQGAPENVKAAIEKAALYLNGGEENDPDEDAGPRLYSFTKDARMIFAAFRQTHGIDLQTARLHWWEFLALFMDLGQDTTFCQLVGLRKRLKTGKATKEERQAAREMGDLIEVPEPDTRTIEEREKELEFLRLIGE